MSNRIYSCRKNWIYFSEKWDELLDIRLDGWLDGRLGLLGVGRGAGEEGCSNTSKSANMCTMKLYF